MRKTAKTISVIGAISATAAVLLVILLQTNPLGIAAPDERCLPTSLSAISEKSFPIRQPSLGYVSSDNIRGIDEGLDLVTIYYADFSMCPFDEQPEEMIMKGAVKVTIFRPGIELKDSLDFQEKELAYYTSNPDIIAEVKAVEVNDYKGIGWEPYEGQSIIRINGEVVESTPTQEPGAVKFYNEDDGTVYFITANRPLENILEIAESIQ